MKFHLHVLSSFRTASRDAVLTVSDKTVANDSCERSKSQEYRGCRMKVIWDKSI